MGNDAINWNEILLTEDGQDTFCRYVSGQTLARATFAARTQGLSIAEAVNQAIEAVAREIESDDAPAGLADAYRQEYGEHRSEQMHLVAAVLEKWKGLD